MLCATMDAFFANRDKFDPASTHQIEGKVLGHLAQIGSRDLGMLKPSTSQKLLQGKRES